MSGSKDTALFADDSSTIPNAPMESENAPEHKEKMNLEEVTDSSITPLKPVENPDPVSDNGNFQDEAIASSSKDLPVPVLEPSAATSTDWAEMINVSQPVPEFREKINEMAQSYPFELDIFQKQAILKLEEGHHVLVAAHTSAGKTVVAEYAIAMSRRNGTKTIYTSPIKALSHQKYKSFGKMFGDVGLLTGDMQINTSASCMVQTTEILRLQLYRGLDTSDLEFVIFDEVHYMNNAERGYVWEEVFIMLPAHVCMVMLSATVPDPLQFATWLGRIKQRKVYVVSTSKRPVPLCHYLFAGSDASRQGSFLIINQDGEFNQAGYDQAVAAHAQQSRKQPQDLFDTFLAETGNAGPRKMSRSEKNMMMCSMLRHIRAQDKLPVIIFSFSRQGCDSNAQALLSMYHNYTTHIEKSRIQSFCEKFFEERLIAGEWTLPQVVSLQKALYKGIGVHHGGMLPVLKEIVEILFQYGFIKVLFATDTLAMGMNVPARTVVFDTLRKTSGQQFCTLTPAEYTQMAGRAGRRGLDDTGSVFILCKEDVPELETLKGMTLGLPENLSSQFRLTYGMILKLLRSGTVSVESMMHRSFREFRMEETSIDLSKQLQFEKDFSEKCRTPLEAHQARLASFFDTAAVYIDAFNKIMPILLSTNKIKKEMTPGRILVISTGPYINQLGVLLNNVNTSRVGLEPKQAPYKVLVLDTKFIENEYNFDLNENWHRMLSLSAKYDSIGTKENTLDHIIINIEHKNIIAVTKQNMQINHQVIIDVWERRQLPRFKDAPIGPICTNAVQELSRISRAVNSGTTTLEHISLTESLSETTEEISTAFEEMNKRMQELNELKKYTDIPNFITEFAIVYERKLKKLKFDKDSQLLFGNLELYPEYQKRLIVLKELNFIDDFYNVTLKGQIACGIATHELMISELVFRGVFSDYTPAEIVALLSCFVFQTRMKFTNVTHLTNKVQEGVRTIVQIREELTAVESKYLDGQRQIGKIDFGLVKEVYQWATQSSFTGIMDCSFEQEGIIVRCIQQLNELLQNVYEAAGAVGDVNLQNALLEAHSAIWREIVCSTSIDDTPEHQQTLLVNVGHVAVGDLKLQATLMEIFATIRNDIMNLLKFAKIEKAW